MLKKQPVRKILRLVKRTVKKKTALTKTKNLVQKNVTEKTKKLVRKLAMLKKKHLTKPKRAKKIAKKPVALKKRKQPILGDCFVESNKKKGRF